MEDKRGIKRDLDRVIPVNKSKDLCVGGDEKKLCDSTHQAPYNGICDVLQNRYVVETAACTKQISSYNMEVSYGIKSMTSGEKFKLVLLDSWAIQRTLKVNYVIGLEDVEKDENNIFTISRDKGQLIANPDKLFTVTAIVGQNWCERKSAIQQLFKSKSSNIAALRGTVAHLFVAMGMKKKVTEMKQLDEMAEDLMKVPDIREQAYGNGMKEKELRIMINDLKQDISNFLKNRFLCRSDDQKWEVMSLQDIEDNYWSPQFGIKGKIDATINVQTNDNLIKTIPLEFKTGSVHKKGKSQVRSEHQGQLILYTLMMRPRYGDISEGVLSYITENGYNEVLVTLRDLQALIQARNRLEMNTRIKDVNFLECARPEADYETKCRSCEARTSCSLLLEKQRKNVKSSVALNATEDKLRSSLSHLTAMDMKFWDTWYDVVTIEADEEKTTENMARMWNVHPKTREQVGDCITDLKWSGQVTIEPKYSGAEIRYIVQLRSRVTRDFRKSFLSENDVVIVSTEAEICIAFATVLNMTKNEITLSIEDDISRKNISKSTVLTLDKMKSNSSFQCMLANLSSLMQDNPHANRLRQYLIHRKQPIFAKFNMLAVTDLIPSVQNLNDDQLKLMAKALSTDSFLFVKGMPGTGKTYSIIRLIQLLLRLKKSVLVVAYTHSAVDNIMYRLQCEDSTNFIRVDNGRIGEPRIRHRLSSKVAEGHANYSDMCKEFDTVPVVGTTLLSLIHPIFSKRRFDYCIVDEASQALVPSVLTALLVSDKYVVFGDPDQLPPVIKSLQVKEMKLQADIFALASTPMSTVKMTVQYRMNSRIMDLANKLVYRDQMTCATTKLENTTIKLGTQPDLGFLKSTSALGPVVSNNIDKAVIFVDTKKYAKTINAQTDRKCGESFENIFEADFIHSTVLTLIEIGYAEGSIGIIAPYRGQVKCLSERVPKSVEVNTVDQYQGREKDIIICSFTRSNPKREEHPLSADTKNTGGIMEDMRRLNVAITRAKKKLIMVGDSETLKQFSPFQKLFEILPDSSYMVFKPSEGHLSN